MGRALATDRTPTDRLPGIDRGLSSLTVQWTPRPCGPKAGRVALSMSLGLGNAGFLSMGTNGPGAENLQ